MLLTIHPLKDKIHNNDMAPNIEFGNQREFICCIVRCLQKK